MFEKTLNKVFARFIFCIIVVFFFVTGCGNDQEKKIEIDQVIHLQKTTLGVATIASGLNVPWEIAWGPDNTIWITEQSGTVSRIDPESGTKKVLLVIPSGLEKKDFGFTGNGLIS
jgi:glucose/arabinose dehydrogenase